MSEQKKLHEPIEKWFELKGVKALPSSEKIHILIKDVFPLQNYIFPDIIGIRKTKNVVVVEVETDVDEMIQILPTENHLLLCMELYFILQSTRNNWSFINK